MTTHQARRYYVRDPDAQTISGYDTLEAATLAATEYGEGTFVVDTMAQAYKPMLHQVRGGTLVYAGYGGWDTGRFGPDRDLIEAIKKGHAALAHAFLAKGASASAADTNGGAALHWAVGGGKIEIIELLLEHGADKSATDGHGQTALELAQKRGREEIAELLAKSNS